jgi:hypothetical protein
MSQEDVAKYSTNSGKVDKNSGPQPEKDESTPNPFAVPRQPVVPQRGRPADAPPCPGSSE